MKKHYQIIADPKAIRRWFLMAPCDQAGQEIDPRVFTNGTAYDGPKPVRAPLRRRGDPVDFNFGAFDYIVVTHVLGTALTKLQNGLAQRFPITIEAYGDGYEIFNLLNVVDCFDEARSEFTRWGPNDIRPDKIGQLCSVLTLRVDISKTAGCELFRLAGWPIAVIASERVKSLFEDSEVTGVAFQEVG